MHTPSRWARIRAGLIAAVLGLNLLIALPQPSHQSSERMQRPEAVEELDDWVALLESWGVHTTRAQLAERTRQGVELWLGFRRALIARPTRPLRRWLGIRQAWALFARPDSHPTSLIVEVREGPAEPWREVYHSLEADRDLLAGALRYRRVRGLYDTGAYRSGTAANLYRWICVQTLGQLPEADAARIRVVQRHVVRPGQPEDPRQEVVFSVAHHRQDLGL